MEEKDNYILKFYTSHRKLQPFVSNNLYNVTREFAENVCLGICMGMRCKYKHPRVELYQLLSGGGEKLIREQR